MHLPGRAGFSFTKLGWAGLGQCSHTISALPPPTQNLSGVGNVVIVILLIASKWSQQPFD